MARSGSLKGAARPLGNDHSIAYRRLQALEVGLGQPLFDRAAGLYRPTEAGAQPALAAERIEAETLALDRAITGQDARQCSRRFVWRSRTRSSPSSAVPS